MNYERGIDMDDDEKKQAQRAQQEDARDLVAVLRDFQLGKSEAVLIAALQATIGFALLIALEMPWSLAGYALVLIAAFFLKSMKAVHEEFDRSDGDGHG